MHTSSNSLHSTMGYKENGMFQATLLFASKPIGLIECQDATPQKAMQFFEQILGKDANFNESNYLCGPTCRGKCVPRPDHVGIPPSIYPFGCNCDILNGCDIKGPNVRSSLILKEKCALPLQFNLLVLIFIAGCPISKCCIQSCLQE